MLPHSWYTSELLENFDRKQGNLARKYFETKALFKNGINFLTSAQRMNVLRLWDALKRFTVPESLFTRLNDQKSTSRCIEIFKRRRVF